MINRIKCSPVLNPSLKKMKLTLK